MAAWEGGEHAICMHAHDMAAEVAAQYRLNMGRAGLGWSKGEQADTVWAQKNTVRVSHSVTNRKRISNLKPEGSKLATLNV